MNDIELKQKADKYQYEQETKMLKALVTKKDQTINELRNDLYQAKYRADKFRKERDNALAANFTLEGKLLDLKDE